MLHEPDEGVRVVGRDLLRIAPRLHERRATGGVLLAHFLCNDRTHRPCAQDSRHDGAAMRQVGTDPRSTRLGEVSAQRAGDPTAQRLRSARRTAIAALEGRQRCLRL